MSDKLRQVVTPSQLAFRLVLGVSVLLFLVGCSDSPEARVEKASQSIAKTLADAKKLASELSKSEKSIADERQKLAELIARLNGLMPSPIPTPNPAPSPVPTPTPPGPLPPVPSPSPTPTGPVDGRFGLARAVWKIASAVNSPDRLAESNALAGVFDAVAAQVAAGTLDGTLLEPQWRKVMLALAAGNKPILAAHLAAWKPAADQLGEAISTRYSEGKLKTNTDWRDMLSEIASGLKAVK